MVAFPVQQDYTLLSLDVIRTDGGTQPRVNQDWKIIDEYAQDMLQGAVFPPVIVYFDGANHWLADGFHRYHAAKQAEKEIIAVDIRQGSQRDAILFSVGVNAHHGFRRTSGDKRAVVEKLLRDEEWSKWSNSEIARRCGVNHHLVAELRSSLGVSPSERTYITKHGSIATMNIVNIGQQPQNVPSQPFAPQFYHEPVQKYAPDDIWLDHSTTQIEEEQPVEPCPLARGVPSALISSESNEWYTPAQYIDAARELMGEIDIDPASCERANQVVKAARIYTGEDSGLNRDWPGHVWLNPPYGFTGGESNQAVWSGRLIDQFQNGITTEAVLLVNANTEAKWFQPLNEYLICFTDHRIRFYNQSGDSSQPTQGNAFVYFGKQQRRFIEIFSRFGRVKREAKIDEW